MARKFQQIYLEITNICNLSCYFCRKDSRKKEFMDFESFKKYIELCSPFTDSFYLHLKGEPLIHPDIVKILDFLDELKIKTKITTNGTYLNKLGDELLRHQNIKHINISLQAISALKEEEIDDYLHNLLAFTNKINNQYIHLRNWINSDTIFNYVSKIYPNLKNEDNYLINNHLIYHLSTPFVWPNDEEKIQDNTPCLGGKMQLGVLVNGDVVLCCLDDEGKTKIGNLNNETLDEILQSEIYHLSIDKMPYFALCKKCRFRIRFKKEDV